MNEQRITVDYFARVEGEAALDIKAKDGKVTDVLLNVVEPPRFFQGFLVGRHYSDVPDMVARICGICPVSHELTAILALEDAMGVTVSPAVSQMRKLLAVAQTIQSHVLHIYLLAAPDFLGYESALAMVPDHLPIVAQALKMKKLGNDLTAAIGGRAVHPITAVVGGFTKMPEKADLMKFIDPLKAAKDDALATVKLVATLPLPDFTRQCEHVALRDPAEFAINTGRLVSTEGLDTTAREYRQFIKEHQKPPSHTLLSSIEGRGSFMTGPLPRVNLNFDQLSKDAKQAAKETEVTFPNFNPFVSVLARAIELVHWVDESIAMIQNYEPDNGMSSFPVKAGTGAALTEAPRGTLYHSYKVDGEGMVEFADIVSPTAHNVNNMEKDLWAFAPELIKMNPEEATLKAEMAIRNYDPCFSCSAHFLKLRIQND